MARSDPSDNRLQEVMGVLLLALGLLTVISLISYHPHDPSLSSLSSQPEINNLAGRFGSYFADILLQFIGGGSYLLAGGCLLAGWRKLFSHTLQPSRWSALGLFLLLWSSTVIFDFFLSSLPSVTSGAILLDRPGGLVGKISASLLSNVFAPTGAYLVVGTAFFLSLMLTTSISLPKAAAFIKKQASRVLEFIRTRITIYHEQSRRWKTETQFRKKVPLRKPKIIDRPKAPSAPPPPPKQENFSFAKERGEYDSPPLGLLQDPEAGKSGVSKEELVANSQILETKLRDYGIEGRVAQVHPGPVVTMYEFEPAPGVKVQKIVNLSDDLALAMRALSVRVVAPIPGKSVVGIEIPNTSREIVNLKEMLSSEAFTTSESRLKLALGKDISGTPIVADLAAMPHLLVAGATGSGKSVALNTMILSLLYGASPDEVKMIMIDPKLLELSTYDGIPHLQTPVIVRPKDTPRVFQKLVEEMQSRYRLLAEMGARNIESYNKKARKENGGSPGSSADNIRTFLEESHTLSAEDGTLTRDKPFPILPYLVVIIDELADLMLVASREVEDSITRLAQMARAAGIHLIVATQRPSVDVLTGLIKANFPARIAFQVTSKTDSRTILDANGAEQLLGKGDMLYMSPGSGPISRIHGAYVSEEEIRGVVEHVKAQGKPHYVDLLAASESSDSPDLTPDERDELYSKAVNLITSAQSASASLIQRRLRVGYPRAARMIEMMEEDGIVGPASGGKPREVFSEPEGPLN